MTQHALSGVTCLGFVAWLLWILGYPAQALRRSHEMFTLVQELSHAYTRMRALVYAANLYGLRQEGSIAQERAEAALALATEQGFGNGWAGNGRAGPGTPCGELMRRYWHPVAATVQLADNPVRKIRILGEDLGLFRDRSENLGLIEPCCPHRAMHMAFGIPEEVGLRCPYHGWLVDGTGRCLEQPLAPPDSTFKDRVRMTAYKVQEMGGLVWAYLGPESAPLLPRLDLCERDHELRQIVGHRLIHR